MLRTIKIKSICDRQYGFSLVELAIVLVILGLLVGGVLSGQALIKSAAHRKVLVDYSNYRTAVNSFRDKYLCLPGDCPNFASFMPGETNGNGDNQFYLYSDERCTFWRHMAVAGLINGNYSNNCNGGYMVAGDSGPRMSTNNEDYFTIFQAGTVDYSNYSHDFPIGNWGNVINTYKTCTSGQWCGGAVFTPKDAWQLDTKADDGMPYSGSILSSMGNEVCWPDQQYHGNQPYNISSSNVVCSLIFVTGF